MVVRYALKIGNVLSLLERPGNRFSFRVRKSQTSLRGILNPPHAVRTLNIGPFSAELKTHHFKELSNAYFRMLKRRAKRKQEIPFVLPQVVSFPNPDGTHRIRIRFSGANADVLDALVAHLKVAIRAAGK